MIGALIIVFREVFEAGLVIGIVMAATRAVAHREWWIAAGATAGVLGAGIAAIFARALSALFGGVGQELFNAGILAVAVVMLSWHNVWMARHGRKLAAEVRAVGEAVVSGSRTLAGLAIVVAIAVLREGVEVVLFLYGVVISAGEPMTAILTGAAIGLLSGALVCALTYFGLLTIPTRYLFAVTSILIAFLAAGMAAQATSFLEQANVVTALDAIAWDSSWIVSETSIAGRVLHTLIGYSDQPTIMQLLVYLATLAGIFVLMKLYAPAVPARAAGMRPG